MEEIINGVKCLGFAEVQILANGKHQKLFWFECPFCRTKFKTRKVRIRTGHTRSCGCIKSTISCENIGVKKMKYNDSHPLYTVLHGILKRCGYRKGARENILNNYANRGIDVYVEWVENPDSFIDYCLNNGYRDGLQIDRIDNNKGYYPDNIRFVTPKINTRNRRNTVRLPDGTPLADYLEGLGYVITTKRPDGHVTPSKEYSRILQYYIRNKTLPPYIMDIT